MRRHSEVLSWEEDISITALRNPTQLRTEGERLRTCHSCEAHAGLCGVTQPILFLMTLTTRSKAPREPGLSIQEQQCQRGRCFPPGLSSAPYASNTTSAFYCRQLGKLRLVKEASGPLWESGGWREAEGRNGCGGGESKNVQRVESKFGEVTKV